MQFKATKEGFDSAKQYAMKIGKLNEFNSIKDSYLQLNKANQWYNDRQ